MPEQEPVGEPLPFRVGEDAPDWLDTGIYVQTGQRVVITAAGTIWAGVAFTGRNGPNGWRGWTAGPDFPLPDLAAPYSLIGNISGRPFFVGDGMQFVHREPPASLFLRVNDNVPGNGNGAFAAVIEIWQDRTA